MNDAIFALSSGHGKAGIAVIRVSGSNLHELFKKIVRPIKYAEAPPRRASPDTPPLEGGEATEQARTLLTPVGGEYPRLVPRSLGEGGSRGGGASVESFSIIPRHAYLADLISNHEPRITNHDFIDRAIAIYFPSPNSFTGEDVIEFYTHGSVAVIEKLFDTLRSYGARMAEPGEFSRRAFDNGKMDLITADGISALIDARTERQRISALKSAAGGDSVVYESWRSQMIEISAYAAAMLDYPENELPENIGETLLCRTKKLHNEIEHSLRSAKATRAIRSGFNIVLAGPTNAGKSSLFNRLMGESRAIVSEIPGTTRDVVSAELDIDGYLVRLSDTAGLRDTEDSIEKIGIEKTNSEVENADLVLRVQSSEFIVQSPELKDNEILVINKSDLLDNSTLHTPHSTLISAITGSGVEELLSLIKQKLHEQLDGAESDVAVNQRTKDLLSEAVAELEFAIRSGIGYQDIFSEHVRRAADAIGKILGVIGADEIADKVFGNLCLGK
jgi:tRNA modification GTPase